MAIAFKILENPAQKGTLTLKMEDGNLAFNHTLIHNKDVFESFEQHDFGIESINGLEVYHVNGHIITREEYEFIAEVFEEL